MTNEEKRSRLLQLKNFLDTQESALQFRGDFIFFDNLLFILDTTRFYKPEVALNRIEKAKKKNHKFLGFKYEDAGNTFANHGEYAKAAEFYESALKIRKRPMMRYLKCGWAYKKMEEYKQAYDKFDAYLLEERSCGKGHLCRGQIEALFEKRENCILDYWEYLELEGFKKIEPNPMYSHTYISNEAVIILRDVAYYLGRNDTALNLQGAFCQRPYPQYFTVGSNGERIYEIQQPQ